MAALPLASFKLRFHDNHVRVVPSHDAAGCAFAGAGVDLRGDEAREALALCGPILAWIDAREPGGRVRALSYDLTRGRLLVTLAEEQGRPRVVRVDPPQSEGIRDRAGALLLHLGAAAHARLLLR